MTSNEEVLSKIVSERTDKIQSKALEQIQHIQESTERELARIVPDLLKQIENFSVFKTLDVLDVIRNGGVVKTCDYEIPSDHTHWGLELGSVNPFYDGLHSRMLDKGHYRVTLIIEKLAEEDSPDLLP